MRNQVFKKLFSVLLALIMVAGLLPASAMAGGWGAMDVDTTPVPTETVQQTESAEPTAPTETETPEVTEVPEPTPENPATTVEPTQGEPTAEPTDEGIMPANVMPVQANVAARDTSGDPFYRIVHLDCGRKYFSVENIKKLIDVMALYGYNQLQLAFGNDGFRFLLDDMKITVGGSEISDSDMKNNIKAGNVEYTGSEDEREKYLTQAEMDEIILYAKGKGIGIVPFINMPGHMNALLKNQDGYKWRYNSSKYPNSLNIDDEASRKYAYAILKKYVEYFSGKGCEFFNFGADEFANAGEDYQCGTGNNNPAYGWFTTDSWTNMQIFMNDCIDIIESAGMTARCFNDAICYNNINSNCGDVKKSVQIYYWGNGWSGFSPATTSTLIKNGYTNLINNSGSWYYVLKNEGYVQMPAASSSFASFDATKFADNNTVTGPIGATFCIWCDNYDLHTDDEMFNEANDYNVQKQVIAMAKQLWNAKDPVPEIEFGFKDVNDIPQSIVVGTELVLSAMENASWTVDDDTIIKIEAVEDVKGSTVTGVSAKITALKTGKATIAIKNAEEKTASITLTVTEPGKVQVDLIVGDKTEGSKTFDVDGSAEAKDYITGEDAYIATAVVGKTQGEGEGTVTKVASITSDGSYYISDGNGNYLTLENGTLKNETDVTKATKWTFTHSNTNNVDTFTIKSNGYYLLWYNVGYGLSAATSGTYKSYKLNDDGIIVDSWGYTPAGTAITYENGWKGSRNGNASPYEYKAAEVTKDALTITAIGEGKTTVKVGNTTYNITVTAPERTETIQLAHGGTYTLPEGAEVTETTGDNVITVSGTTVTAGQTDGTATVAFVTKNGGDKITAKYTYTFNVSAIDWSKAPSLPVQLWVTNMPVGRLNQKIDGTDENGLKITVSGTSTICTPATPKMSAEYAHKEEGVLLREYLLQGNVVGEYGISYSQSGSVNMTDGEPTQYKFWKGVVLHNGDIQNHQNGTSSDKSDKSMSGSNIEKVRYWANSEENLTWQYLEGNEWKDFVDINEASSEGKDTLIAYYLQKFVITDEITTLTRDYGGQPSSSMTEAGGTTSWNSKFTATCFAVVYPGNVLSRSEEKIYEAAMMRGLNPSTDYDKLGKGNQSVGVVYAENTSDRIVSKITVVKAKSVNLTNSTWPVGNGTNNPIEWQKKTLDSGAEWYDERIVWSKDNPELYGTTPYFVGAKFDSNGDPDLENSVYFTKDMQAYLILVYLEDVQKEDSLEYVYWDDNAQKRINPKEYFINVNAGDTFISGLKQGGNVIGGTKHWPGKQGEEGYLPDDAYIVNSGNGEIRFNKDITVIDGVAANYRSGIYEYVGADISEDGKTLTLHYNLKEITDKHSFVVDFGLPVEITGLLGWFNVTEAQTVKNLSLSQANLLTDSTGSWGRAVINTTTWDSMTYTLNKMLSAKATIPLYCNLDGEQQLKTWIEIIPATSVYYEDSFAKLTAGSYNGRTIDWIPVTDGTNQDANTPQALEALGNKTNVYGYDPAYQDSTMFSMGSARKVTVTNDMAKDGVVWPTAQFTFKGTGFDIISLTDNTSGAIFVDVYNTNTGNKEKSVFVDNYYGYTYNSETNTWDATPEKANALYQIPVIALRNLPYAEYNVVIKVAYSEYFDHTAKPQGSYSFWLDAVRVYDPMGKDNAIYNTGKEKEGYPQYIKLRNELAKDAATRTGVVFIDGAANANIALYANYGPNNEVYLAKGQAITFELNVGDGVNIKTIQIAAKAPNGEAYMAVTGDVNHSKAIGTATEMYYELNESARTFTIANTGEGILSLTNAKITYAEKATVELGSIDTKAEENAVQAVRALFAPAPIEPEPEPEPEKTFEPERFEASWSRNVMQGRKATLTVKTSEDVEAITVDGQTIRSYRTRTERMGFGRRAKRITYREFTYSMVAQESADFSVTAINAEGTESEAITARLTVKTRPNSMRDMWDWFKGWF